MPQYYNGLDQVSTFIISSIFHSPVMACCKELCDELSDKTDILLNLSTTGLIGFFGQKKNKLTWSGTLNDLKTFVSTIIDEKTAEGAAWRSPSGGKWCFTCEDLEITWHSKSGVIIF